MHYYRIDTTILPLENGYHEGENGQYMYRSFLDFSNFKSLYHPTFSSHRPLHRIFSLARRAGSDLIVFEKIRLRSQDIDGIDTVRGFTLGANEPDALRISFLKHKKFDNSVSKPPIEPIDSEHYEMTGYVVFLIGSGNFSDNPGQVYEAVLAPCWKLPDVGPFIHCCKEYTIKTAIGLFKIRGVLYAQQNKRTTFCSHAAMRMALSCVIPEGDIEYDAIISQIRQHLSSKRPETLFDDYEFKEFVEIMNSLGKLNCTSMQWAPDNAVFYQVLYDLVESGTPVILGYPYRGTREELDWHAVTIIGHTFDDHSWAPVANQMYFTHPVLQNYSSSANYANTFVLHDDNCGPYLTLPRNFFAKNQFPVDDMRPILFGLTKRRTPMSGFYAEYITYQTLDVLFKSLEAKEEQSWFAVLYRHYNLKRLVLRPIKISYERYVAYLEKLNVEKESLSRISNHILNISSYWMVEISCHELFGISKQKFGEILLYDVDISQDQYPSVQRTFALARLPQIAIFNLDGTLIIETSIDSYTPLIVSEQYTECG